jgi:hypothetical protein
MRTRFFGCGRRRAGARRPSIVVSPHGAFWGAVVPLDVPVTRTCGLCGGRG